MWINFFFIGTTFHGLIEDAVLIFEFVVRFDILLMASSVKYSPGDALKCRDTHNTGRNLVPNEKKLIHTTCIHIVDNYF